MRSEEVISRHVHIVGSSSNTNAGLGVSSQKNDFVGKLIAELGAIPRANKGLLGIDEINDMPQEKLNTLTEAMETGSVTSQKTGAHGSYPADVKVLATGNPFTADNKLNTDLSLWEQNFGLVGKLKDRFDFIIPFVNTKSLRDAFMSKKDYYCEPAYNDYFIRRYITYAEQFDPIIPRELLANFQKVFVGLTTDNMLYLQSPYRIVRKCENLVKAVARFHLASVVTKEHIMIASKIYGLYVSMVENFNQKDSLNGFFEELIQF